MPAVNTVKTRSEIRGMLVKFDISTPSLMFLSIDQLEKSASRAPDKLDAARVGRQNKPTSDLESALVSDNILSPGENLAKRREMLAAVSVEPLDFAFERAIGKNDAVYSNFADLIEDAKRKVGKIAVKQGSKIVAFATGFMVSPRLLLTNWHVFNSKADAATSEVTFFYEYDINGDAMQGVCYKLDADNFFYSSKELDYCMVAVSPKDITGMHGLEDIGYLYLDPAMGKLGEEGQELLNIIHHPDGDYKQLSIRQNEFVKITDSTIWYKTDTAPGSSGGPVYNDQWQVVALHHMGVAQKNSQGQYTDRDGNPIPETNGKVDGSKVVWIANEGIRISVLLADILGKFPDNALVQDLKVPVKERKKDIVLQTQELAGATAGTTISKTPNTKNMDSNKTDNEVRISFPASLLAASGTINVNISNVAAGAAAGQAQKAVAAVKAPEDMELDEDEVKKLETTTDYSQCKGYQATFLGNGSKSIPIPMPKSNIMKFIAKLQGSNGIVLKYYNYSSIFHSVRMAPIISCVNISGDPADRKDNAKRKDNWLRDNRISMDIQLGDEYYSKSGFDRGHMSRREDAKWGDTAEDAERNANLTCMYTNACPQVPTINRPENPGLWGKLEQVVLEKGIEKEVGRTSMASVFNGPIFQDSDPVFKGIQVPMDFYKIVIWVTDAGGLKATAFRLTQVKLVSDIDFEEIDIDKNTQFKPFQVSIQSLQDATSIDFSAILPLDTFEAGGQELTEESVSAHIAKHNKN